MTDIDKLKKLFPNTSTVAYYSPFGQHIVLNTVEENEYKKAISDLYNLDNLPTIKIFTHELRHWKDHHTTLWGLNNLIDIYNAINARLLNKEEYFHYIVTYFKNAKKSDLTEYYHTKVASFDVEKNRMLWGWRLTVGSRFDSNGKVDHNLPIQFVRFENPKNNELLSRTPLSNSSLLETNAVFEELRVSSMVYQKLPKGQGIVELKLLEKEYFKWLYNHELTLYSVSAHLVSSILQKNDIFQTFGISNQISNLLLNLPENLYDSIPINVYLHEFSEKNKLLKGQKDNGFAFLNLLLNYKDQFGVSKEFEINDLLIASNLPPKKTIEEIVLNEFNLLEERILKGPFAQKLLKKIENAKSYFVLGGLDSTLYPVLDFLKYDNPTVVFGDTLVDDEKYDYELFKQIVLRDIPITNTGWFLMQQDIFKEMETFYNICGI